MKVVKQAFVQLALQTHPDKEGGSAAEFLKVRQAFEEILAQHDDDNNNGNGGNGNNNNGRRPKGWSTEDLQHWWQQETGEFLSFEMSHSTRQEVIRAYHTMGPSDDVGPMRDKGGYWEMARQLAEREAARHGEAADDEEEEERPVALLEDKDSAIHRRRRRKR